MKIVEKSMKTFHGSFFINRYLFWCVAPIQFASCLFTDLILLEPNIAVSLLVSSDFLKMDGLVSLLGLAMCDSITSGNLMCRWNVVLAIYMTMSHKLLECHLI